MNHNVFAYGRIDNNYTTLLPRRRVWISILYGMINQRDGRSGIWPLAVECEMNEPRGSSTCHRKMTTPTGSVGCRVYGIFLFYKIIENRSGEGEQEGQMWWVGGCVSDDDDARRTERGKTQYGGSKGGKGQGTRTRNNVKRKRTKNKATKGYEGPTRLIHPDAQRGEVNMQRG